MNMPLRTQRQAASVPTPSFASVRTGLQRQTCGAPSGQSLLTDTRVFMEPRFGSDFSRVPVHFPLPGIVQAKLAISQRGDIDEQEADRVAEQVTRMPASSLQRACSPCAASGAPCPKCREEEVHPLHRKTASSSALESTEVPHHTFLHSLGPGRPLDAATQAFFEPRLGAAFGHVRVHTDAQAAQSARSIDALAYTVGADVVFGAGQYRPETSGGQRLLAHELVHVLQQGGALPRTMHDEGSLPRSTFEGTGRRARSQGSDVIQRAGDPAARPPGLRCPTDLTPGQPAGTDVLFASRAATITAAHTTTLTTFRAAWLAAGGTDDILVHGYASTDGDEGTNWTLSCDRAEAVQAALVRLGIPAVRISIVAHGESTDFGSGSAPNRHAVISTQSSGIVPLPFAGGFLTADDDFAGRSGTRFGVDEVIKLTPFSFPPRPAADFGGLEWHLVSGGGTLTQVTNVGTAMYRAPATAGAVVLELRVATGATAGRVISSHAITIVTPSDVRMTEVPGTAPSFSFIAGVGGTIPAGTWGAGFRANIFIDPKDVSFKGVGFGEGTVPSVVTGSFMTFTAGPHPVGTLSPGQGGNAITGTPLSPTVDNIFTGSRGPVRTLLGVPICGASDFLWAIPWEFSVAGGPRTFLAPTNHHATSTFLCDATIEKAGAGPFCRSIDGTSC